MTARLCLAGVLLLAGCGSSSVTAIHPSPSPSLQPSPTAAPSPSPTLPPCDPVERTLVDVRGVDNGRLPAASVPFYPCYDIDRSTGKVFDTFTVRMDWTCSSDQSTDVIALIAYPDGKQAYSPSVESTTDSGSGSLVYNVPLQPTHLKIEVVDSGCTFHATVRGHSYLS